MKNYDKYHLKVFEDLHKNYGIKAFDIRQAIWDGKCDGLLLEYKPDINNIFGSNSNRYLFLSKPESVEKVEEILHTNKIVLIKDNEYRIRFATSSVPITGFDCCKNSMVSQDKSVSVPMVIPFLGGEIWDSAREKEKIAVFEGIVKFLMGIDIIDIPKPLNFPVMSYSKLNENEYMISTLHWSWSELPIVILVKDEKKIGELWSRIEKEGLLKAAIKILKVMKNLPEESLYLEEGVEGYIKVMIDPIIRRKYMSKQLLIDKLYEVVTKYNYDNVITKKDLAKAIKGLIKE